jgi:Tfp pilus assembly protein PilZ
MGFRTKTLEVSFRDRDEFEREYWANVSNGGIFVACDEELAERDRVTVHIKLRFIKKGINLKGEVVHVVGRELAASGATPGVAVQFEAPPAEIRAVFEPVLEAIAAEGPGDARKSPTTPPPPPDHDDRRAAPRSRARVRARVNCPGCEIIEGRTRNLSITGVLVSIGHAPPIDIGEPVRVTITHPATGDEREILGKIARHVKGEGGVVRAIGVQFYVRDSERKAVEQFLRDLRATEHSRHLGGIQGEISELGLGNLVQTFGMAAREGTLDVMRGAEEGYLAFENGLLREANLGGTRGVKALARMLTWTEGRFEFHSRIDPAQISSDPQPLEGALLEAMRLIDEGSSIDKDAFPKDACLDVDTDASPGSEMEKLEGAILDLASTGMNVQRILDIVPETDEEIYLAMSRLCDLGVLSVRRA